MGSLFFGGLFLAVLLVWLGGLYFGGYPLVF